MPLIKVKKGSKKLKRAIASHNISEMHRSKTYARTLRKFGKSTTRRQAIAVGLKAAGLSKRKTKKRK